MGLGPPSEGKKSPHQMESWYLFLVFILNRVKSLYEYLIHQFCLDNRCVQCHFKQGRGSFGLVLSMHLVFNHCSFLLWEGIPWVVWSSPPSSFTPGHQVHWNRLFQSRLSNHDPQSAYIECKQRRNIKEEREKNADPNGCVCFCSFKSCRAGKGWLRKAAGNQAFPQLCPCCAEASAPHTGADPPQGGSGAAESTGWSQPQAEVPALWGKVTACVAGLGQFGVYVV